MTSGSAWETVGQTKCILCLSKRSIMKWSDSKLVSDTSITCQASLSTPSNTEEDWKGGQFFVESVQDSKRLQNQRSVCRTQSRRMNVRVKTHVGDTKILPSLRHYPAPVLILSEVTFVFVLKDIWVMVTRVKR